MIRCLIVDDEIIAHQILEHYITQSPDLTLVAKCRNALEAFAMLEKHQIDLIFLDIEMPLVNGLSFLKTLTTRPAVILTTAYAEYALEGYELDVVDYLLKPFSSSRFTKAVDKLRARLSPQEPTQNTTQTSPTLTGHLVIKERSGLIKVSYEDIIAIEASRDYMKIITPAQPHLVHITMRQLEEELPPSHFVRTHKSYIVSIPHVRIVRTESVLLSNNTEIPVSPNYKERLLAAFSR
jgi:DNA-binding LytR/AlgR family response regulator